MLFFKKGCFKALQTSQVRTLDHHSGKGHQETVIAVHVILGFDVMHDCAEIVGLGTSCQQRDPQTVNSRPARRCVLALIIEALCGRFLLAMVLFFVFSVAGDAEFATKSA